MKKSDTGKTSFFKFIIIGLIIGLSIGYFAGFLTKNTKKKEIVEMGSNAPSFSEIRAGGYQFTNPLLDCDNFQQSKSENLIDLQNSLTEYINNCLNKGNADKISVYFRSLNNGPWIGFNENEYYTPASLLKVPVLIAVLKKAQDDKTLLKKRLNYNKSNPINQKSNIVDSICIKKGNSYTVEELLEYMIIHSDNNAKEILSELMGADYLLDVMTDLGVNLRNKNLKTDFLTVREYSSFFRILYNASYLNRNMSEKALELLSKTTFTKGLVAGLPKDIKISHKFGERTYDDVNIKQIHDCGIVYLPDSPYLLCVMTRGSDFNNLVKIISDISLIVYNSAIKR